MNIFIILKLSQMGCKKLHKEYNKLGENLHFQSP